MQERENHRLELDLIQHEQDRVAQDKEQGRVEALQGEKAKLLEVVWEQEHRFEIEKERLKAEYSERQMKLEHDINLYEMEIEQCKHEMELQRRLDAAALQKAHLDEQAAVKKGGGGSD